MLSHHSRVVSLIVLGMATVLPSCGVMPQDATPEAKPGAIAIVVGNHANGTMASVTDDVRQLIEAGVESGSSLTVIVADGRPWVATQERLEERGENSLLRKQNIETTLEEVTRDIESAEAKSPEVDLLGAISLAGRAVSGPGERTVVVMDSGLQTTGSLRFQDGGGALLSADPGEVAAQLQRTGQLPDLSGVSVRFIGLGDVTPPQAPLDEAARKRLASLWVGIASAAGATNSTPDPKLFPVRPPEGTPVVSVVPIPAPPVVSLTNEPAVLFDAVTGFIPNTATFGDPDSIRAVLSRYSRQIVESGRHVTVTGTTVRVGARDGEVTLSRDRAQAVADILVEQGVDRSSINVRGVGSDFAGYVPDRDNSGNLDPVKAAQNRRVILTLSDVQ